MAESKTLKFYHIHGLWDKNPVVVAWDAREAGLIFCRRNNLPYVVLYPEEPPGDSECFAHPDNIPKKWAPPKSDELQRQIDSLTTFFVDAVCLDRAPCIECGDYVEDGLTIDMADAKLIQEALARLNQKRNH